MKYKASKSTVDILHKIETIEKNILDLKLSILKNFTPCKQKVISLRDILKGIEITEKDIKTTKKSLYNNTEM